ncbi:MAG TPA: cadherin-like domain-containing protein [Verrucomicrobiae bacterium]
MKFNLKVFSFMLLIGCLLGKASVLASTNVLFDATQTMTVVSSNSTTVTINSGGYLFTYSVDGYWSASAGGTPTGRFFTVLWPNGVEAQAYTAGPLAGTGANITIKRADGNVFDLQAFTGKILLNTAGAGGAFEIMPQVNGNDAFANPLQYDCTGYAGMTFPYTTGLVGYDTYQIHMWGDFALTALTLTDTNIPPTPVDVTNIVAVSAFPSNAGTAGGAGNYPSNSPCSVTASANIGWGFLNWTENGTPVSSSATYNFTVRSDRTLVANFVPAYTVATAATPGYGGAITGGGTFNSNSIVTVQAMAASGYQFVNWTDYGTPVSTATNYSFAATANHALTANFAPLPQTAIFDFDTGWPAVSATMGMPASQSNNAVIAYFSTLTGGWSVQNQSTSAIGATPNLSGNFLYPSTWWSSFQIQFSSPITNFALDFMTGDVSSEYNTASTVRVIAFTNSTAVGTNLTAGHWVNGAYPQGHLNFSSATPFTSVKLDIAPMGVVSGLLFVDNIVVQQIAAQSHTVSATASPTNAGIVSGSGSYASGATATVSAVANTGFIFTGWLRDGINIGTLPDYAFTVTTNTALVAVFTTNKPPVANGGNFFQLTNTPLAINISDMMVNDYDPDGEPVSFVGASATTTNGLPLTNDGIHVFVPANSTADRFSYTITDGNGGTATGTVNIAVIARAASHAVSMDLKSLPGSAVVNFTGVPWYTYTLQRATNATFSGAVQSWPVRAWLDGSISYADHFADLGSKPAQSFYRLRYP